jgi:hypothetical protein
MAGIEISRALHLLGVIFWVGGMGARLLLLGSVRSGTDEMMRSRLFDAQRRIHLRMEVPAFLLAPYSPACTWSTPPGSHFTRPGLASRCSCSSA